MLLFSSYVQSVSQSNFSIPCKVQTRPIRLNVQWRAPMHGAQTLLADPVLRILAASGFNSENIMNQSNCSSIWILFSDWLTRLALFPDSPHTHTHTKKIKTCSTEHLGVRLLCSKRSKGKVFVPQITKKTGPALGHG